VGGGGFGFFCFFFFLGLVFVLWLVGWGFFVWGGFCFEGVVVGFLVWWVFGCVFWLFFLVLGVWGVFLFGGCFFSLGGFFSGGL